MKKIQNTLILAFAFAFVFMHSCKEAETVTPDPVDTTTTAAKATYALDAAPVFNASCAGCHTAGSAIGSLASYDNAKAFTQGGKVLKAMKHQSGAKAMPQGGAKLADDKIAKIEAWINDGYLP